MGDELKRERGRYINISRVQACLPRQLFYRPPRKARLEITESTEAKQRILRSNFCVFSVTSVSSSERSERAVELKQFQSCQVLRIDDADRQVVIVDDDQIVDAMALEEVEDFDGEFVLVHAYGIERHQVGNQAFADFGIGLKMAGEIAVREDAE
jgi:hypothetical protein